MDEAELSQILRDAFRQLGSELAQAFNVPPPLRPLLKGESAVVQINLRRGQLNLTEFDLSVYEDEIRNLKNKIGDQKTEIKSLSLLVEHQNSKEEAELIVDEHPEKPKKKRKKKCLKNP